MSDTITAEVVFKGGFAGKTAQAQTNNNKGFAAPAGKTTGLLSGILTKLAPLAVLSKVKVLTDLMELFVGFIGLGLMTIFSEFKERFNEFKSAFDTVKSFLSKFFSDPIGIISQAFQGLWNWLKEKLPFLEKVESWLSQAFTLIQTFFKDPVGVFKQGIMTLWEYMREHIPFLGKIADFISSIWNGIKDFFKDPIGTIQEALNGAWEWLKDKVPFLEKIETAVKESIEWIKDLPQNIWDFVKDLPKNIWGYMTQLPDLIASAIKGVGGAVFKFFGVDDAIITKRGDVIKTNPNDTLIATQTPENLLGGGGNNAVYNFYGVTPQEMIEFIKSTLGQEGIANTRF